MENYTQFTQTTLDGQTTPGTETAPKYKRQIQTFAEFLGTHPIKSLNELAKMQPWEQALIAQVKKWVYEDKTTTAENLYDKVKDYILNFAANAGAAAEPCIKSRADDLADKITNELADHYAV